MRIEQFKLQKSNLVTRYETAKVRYDELSTQKASMDAKARAIERFLLNLAGRDELLTEFDECLWLTEVDSVMVRKDGALVFRFHDGREIEG